MGFFAKLFGVSKSRAAAGLQAEPLARPRPGDDRIGGPDNPWVCERPANLTELRTLIMATLSDHPQGEAMPTEEANMDALDAMIAEMMKMAFLRQIYGEEGKDWECGTRMYLKGSIQTQEIRFMDGRPSLLFFADFSRFGAF